jgi:hypothetical protein
VESPAVRERARQLDYSRVPAWVRQDSERAARMAKQQMEERDRAGQSGPQPWDMMQSDMVDGHVVDFSKTFAHPPPPPPRLDHLGHPYPRARRWG